MSAPRVLDRKRPFGKVYGASEHRFEQDGFQFDAQGLEVPVMAAPAALSAPTTSTQPPPEPCAPGTLSPAAVRMRRSRERRRGGVVAVVGVKITKADIDRLVARNLLSDAAADDRKAVAAAVRRALDE